MLGRDDTLDISAFPAVPALAVFPLTALTTSIGSRRWTKHRYAVADHGGGARDWRVPPITREPIDFGFGDEQEPMTDETITLEFLAGRIERVLEEIAQMRGDLFVMTGMIHRLDGTVKVLANEVIEHAWLEPQVRKLGEQARIVRLLVERVNLATDGMQVRLRAKGLQTLVEELRLRAAA